MAAVVTQPLAKRAIHLQITPRPSNLGESREILRLLSQFGEVEYFKGLRYDALSAPNAALMIYKDQAAAQECMRRSPIRFRMGKAIPKEQRRASEEPNVPISKATGEQAVLPRGPREAPFGLSNGQSRSISTYTPSSLPRPPSRPIGMPFDPPPPATSPTENRLFQILISSCNRNFRGHIKSGHYYGSFAIDTKMPGQGDLQNKVPIPGLSCVDWKASEKPWNVLQKEIDSEHRGSGRRRKLGELWEEGVRASEAFRDESLPT